MELVPLVVLEKGPSLVKVKALRPLLLAYPSQPDAAYLFQGFLEGFYIPFQGPHTAVMFKKLRSVQGLEHRDKEGTKRRAHYRSLHSLPTSSTLVDFPPGSCS